MDLLFRALGVAAAANSTLARYSLNFIPSNLLIGAVAAAVLIFNVGGWLESVEAGSEPQAVQIAELVSGRAGSPTYVRTTGMLVPEAGYQYGKEDNAGNIERVTMQWVPMVDRESGTGVFVQLPPRHRFGTEPRVMEMTGMLRPMKEFLARELRPSRFEYQGVKMLHHSVLIADDTPGEDASWGLSAASGALLGLLIFLTLKRNTVFRRTGSAQKPQRAFGAPAAPAPEIRATGTFLLDKHVRRFIEVPAVIAPTESGDIAAFANVDASSNFMGVTYAKREGIWAMPIAKGSLQNVEEGVIYYGTRGWPALRFTYRDTESNRSRTAILSVSTPDARQLLFSQLTAMGAAV